MWPTYNTLHDSSFLILSIIDTVTNNMLVESKMVVAGFSVSTHFLFFFSLLILSSPFHAIHSFSITVWHYVHLHFQKFAALFSKAGKEKTVFALILNVPTPNPRFRRQERASVFNGPNSRFCSTHEGKGRFLGRCCHGHGSGRGRFWGW